MDAKNDEPVKESVTEDSKHETIPEKDPPPYTSPPNEGPTTDVPPEKDASHDQTGVLYHDRFITCDAKKLTIRAYYFPWGSKEIPLSTIKSVERIPIGALTGRGRIWGTANPGRWAHLDPARPSKTEALVLHLAGASTQPLLTPNNVAELAEVLARCTGSQVVEGGSHVI